MKNSKNIIWIDMEMTGLDPDVETILEIATIITDPNLNIIATGPEFIIHEPEDRFEKMDLWNQTHHKQSGLWGKVVASNTSLEEAEHKTLAFIKKHSTNHCYLAGNSIWQDRRFIMKHMKKLDKYLHYRMIDVSSIKILADYWFPRLSFDKKNSHRAMDDIKESIEELKFYRDKLFLPIEQLAT
jgi:oligoribonuclease